MLDSFCGEFSLSLSPLGAFTVSAPICCLLPSRCTSGKSPAVCQWLLLSTTPGSSGFLSSPGWTSPLPSAPSLESVAPVFIPLPGPTSVYSFWNWGASSHVGLVFQVWSGECWVKGNILWASGWASGGAANCAGDSSSVDLLCFVSFFRVWKCFMNVLQNAVYVFLKEYWYFSSFVLPTTS